MQLQGQNGELYTCKFSPSGEHVASAGAEKSICKCVDAAVPQLAQHLLLLGYSDGLYREKRAKQRIAVMHRD